MSKHNSTTNKNLYFTAIIPPDPVRQYIHEIKKEFAESYDSSHALRTPPHITLIPPFKLKAKSEDSISRIHAEVAKNSTPFIVQLDGYGAFSPRVIYIKPVSSSDLTELHDALQTHLPEWLKSSDRNLRFNPHITVAFRDLRKATFRKAWEVCKGKSCEARFEVSNICLLKHNGKRWNEYLNFPFTS